MHKWMIPITSALILFVMCTVSAATADFTSIRLEVLEQCQGRFGGKRPTPEELKKMFNAREARLNKLPKKDRRTTSHGLNLCGTDLGSFNLSKADLRGANLSGANIDGTDLRRAHLRGANLRGAILIDVVLQKANLVEANLDGALLTRVDLRNASLARAKVRARLDNVDLSDAFLPRANLSGAMLSNTNLNGAYLVRVDLSGASLSNVNLSNADMESVNLNAVVFEPSDLPDAFKIASARNLALMSYKSNPDALVRLRKLFKETGFYEQERKITFAIKHTEMMKQIDDKGWRRLEGVFSYFIFEQTTFWGSEPRRALLLLLGLIPVFTFPYCIALRHPVVNGIWRKWADDRIRIDLGTEEPELLHAGWRRALLLGLYFSVLSAFNIGWRDLNVGNWIQRLQSKEYTLRATGWVRTVSGVQALISVYLLAIWVLTYFGRPFE